MTEVNKFASSFNVDPMVKKLCTMFRLTTSTLYNGAVLRRLQVNFTYFIDEIQRGPRYDASRLSVFVLHWVQKIDQIIKQFTGGDRDGELNRMANVVYKHQNYHN